MNVQESWELGFLIKCISDKPSIFLSVLKMIQPHYVLNGASKVKQQLSLRFAVKG